jgi:hypothetical protein
MDTEDYLGITALSTLAEKLCNSIETHDVRPIIMEEIMGAAIRWQCDEAWGDDAAAEVKDKFLTEVKGSVDEVLKWRERYEAKVKAESNDPRSTPYY